MPPRQARLDVYGQPLPELADARHEVLKDKPHNQAQRRLLHAALEVHLTELLRRGVYADLSVRLLVVNGMVKTPIDIGVTHHWHLVDEE